VHFDESGKVSLGHIYTQPDPRAYFSTLRELDYRIPQLAKPYFAELLQEYRTSQRIGVPNVLDIGCSYGINAALLRFDLTIDELYERYCGPDAGGQTRDTLLARDRALARARGNGSGGGSADLGRIRFIGLDVSYPALSYALLAGFIDVAVHADLEQGDPTQHQRQQLASADLVISTGCLGYVTDRTIARVAGANGEHKPWMAHFVLRMFPFEPVAQTLAGLGYETVQLDRVFKQRRFASPQEQSLVLDTLSTVGVDPGGRETDGWLYAQLYISRPLATKECVVVDLAPHKDPYRPPTSRLT
jgi:carnitine O-acetyltransferase